MATYGKIQGDINTMNEAQRNDAARAAGYTGWSDYMDNANRPAQNNPSMTNAQVSGVGGSAGGGAGITQGMFTGTQQAGIDLPSLYKNLTATSGISALEMDLSNKQKAYNEAVSKINDNPFLSEATRTGRLQKLATDFQNATAGVRNDIATKKADVETQLNLQTKQFDINSQQAQTAFNQFQSLLSSGALDNASSEDIANITRATGISSSMIQSAVQTRKDANKKDVKTEMIKYDDGTNQGYAIINSQTGEIIKKDSIAASEPKNTSGGSGGLTATQSRAVLASARKAITEVDTNGDKALSLQEYQRAVENIMIETGVDFGTADNTATQAFKELGFKTWKWSQKK